MSLATFGAKFMLVNLLENASFFVLDWVIISIVWRNIFCDYYEIFVASINDC